MLDVTVSPVSTVCETILIRDISAGERITPAQKWAGWGLLRLGLLAPPASASTLPPLAAFAPSSPPLVFACVKFSPSDVFLCQLAFSTILLSLIGEPERSRSQTIGRRRLFQFQEPMF